MNFSTDLLIERKKLKAKAKKWRLIALLVVVVSVLITSRSDLFSENSGGDYIARVEITGVITYDKEKLKALKRLVDNKKVKAVVLYVDSPGGTAVGGEMYHKIIKDIAAEKPVITVMGNVATSAAYMLALPTEKIFAHQSTITGSIGVMMQLPNVENLADKIGISLKNIKSGSLKGEPDIFSQPSEASIEILQEVINDFHTVFVKMVVEGRDLDEEKVRKLADGRIYTATQAVENGLIDKISYEDEAIIWLREEYEIDKKIKVREYSLEPKKTPLSKIFPTAKAVEERIILRLFGSGLLAI